MYNICQAKSFSTSLDTIRPALPKNFPESIELPRLQSQKSYGALLQTELKIIKREDKNNSMIQDFSPFSLQHLDFMLSFQPC